MKKRALITGITGQDGCYLAKLLLAEGYEVVGVLDAIRSSHLWNLAYLEILPSIQILKSNLNDYVETQRLILEVKPSEVYALAAQSSVSASFREPAVTMSTNTVHVMNWLEAIRILDPSIKFYQASSSEMYGNVSNVPVTDETLFNPVSPYAVSKVASHYLVRSFRNAYGLYAVSGILFNHESVLRKPGFFTRKLIDSALSLADGIICEISFGNLDVSRDIGYAPDYVVPMWKMLQQDEPEDHLICTGESITLKELVKHVFGCLDIPIETVQQDLSLHRPAEIRDIFGSPTYASEKLGWTSSFDAKTTMERILNERLTMRGKGIVLPN